MHDPATPAPPPGVLVADHFRQPLGYGAGRPNGTRDWLITLTVGGEGRFRLAGEALRCRAGDVVLLAPGVAHDYGTASEDAPWDFFWAHFLPRPAWLPWLRPTEAGLQRYALADAAARQRAAHAFERLLADARALGPWRAELAANALEEVLLVVLSHSDAAASALDPRVAAVVERIGELRGEPVSVAALARDVGLSPSRLAHLFKQQVGSSIIETAVAARLRQAARLLAFTDYPVAAVAHEAGFQSAFYFSRQFKAYYGQSPSAYRSALRSQA
jgi:AraC family transcriptional regulator of arabinose operon